MSFCFTDCQRKAFHLLETERNVFLTGSAGTGKSELLKQWLRGKDRKEYPVLASTGAAAVIVDGRTFHSFFGLGILEGGRAATVARAVKSRPLHKRLERAECIVIDEVSMLSGETVAAAEEISRIVRDSELPWGGLRVIAVGDFAQLPPVQTEEREKDWAFLHSVWQESDFVSAYLETPVRTTDGEFLSVLRSVREGEVTGEVRSFLDARVLESGEEFEGTRLFPHRHAVDGYNMQQLQSLPGTLFRSITQYEGTARYVEQLKRTCPIPETIYLKEGALIMMRKNDTAFPYSYVNGSLGRITGFEDGGIVVSLLNGEEIVVYRTEFSLIDGAGTVRAQALNFPITLAWATTIHKAQGASIDRLMVNMSRLWESGHAYVALSRARTADGLRVEAWNRESIFVDPMVQEFYEDVKLSWSEMKGRLSDAEPEVSEMPIYIPKKKKKIPNHKQTKELVSEEKSLDEIAEILGWKVATIIGHIAKLQEEGDCPEIAYLKPEDTLIASVESAFEKVGDESLKKVYNACKGKHSYEEIKLVKLFF